MSDQSEKPNIVDNVLEKIQKGEIHMRKRWYFILSAILLFVSITIFFFLSIIIGHIIWFWLKAHGAFFDFSFGIFILHFPWFTLFLGVLSLFSGVWLMKRSEYGYKIPLWGFALGLLVALSLALVLAENIDPDGCKPRRGMMNDFYKKYDVLEEEKNLALPPEIMERIKKRENCVPEMRDGQRPNFEKPEFEKPEFLREKREEISR